MNLLSLAIVWIVSVGLAVYVFRAAGFGWHAGDVAHLIGVLSPSVVVYFAHKHCTFPAGEQTSETLSVAPEFGAARERGR
jgi:hypothetical protein